MNDRTAKKIAKPGQNAIQGAWAMKRWAEFSMLPAGRRRRLLAEAEERQRRLGDDRAGDGERGLHQQRRHDVGQDVAERDAPVRIADGARGLDIVLDLGARCVWPRVSRMKTGVAVTPMAIMALLRLGPRKAASAIARIRNGMASIASTMRDSTRVDPAAGIARQQAERHADAQRDADRHEAGAERGRGRPR